MTIIPNMNMDEDDGMAADNRCLNELVKMDGRTCRCLTCKPGFEAHKCNTADPDTSFCVACPEGQYNHNFSILGRNEKCKYWRKCDGPHERVSKEGGPTYNVECDCKTGYRHSSSANACIYDDSPKETSKIPPIPQNGGKPPNGALSEPSSNTADGTVIGLAIAIPLIIIFVIIIIFLLIRKKRSNKGKKEVAFVNERVCLLEKNIQDITDKDLHKKVLNVCFKEIEHKIGRDWKKLGRNLLGDRLDYALEDARDSSIEEKASEILKRWHQNFGHKATMKALLDALRFIGRQDIIDDLCQSIRDDPDLGSHFRQDDINEQV